jgi:hypothetical protein
MQAIDERSRQRMVVPDSFLPRMEVAEPMAMKIRSGHASEKCIESLLLDKYSSAAAWLAKRSSNEMVMARLAVMFHPQISGNQKAMIHALTIAAAQAPAR